MAKLIIDLDFDGSSLAVNHADRVLHMVIEADADTLGEEIGALLFMMCIDADVDKDTIGILADAQIDISYQHSHQ